MAPKSHFTTTSWSGWAHSSLKLFSDVLPRSSSILTESNLREICLIGSPQIFGEDLENHRQFSPGGYGCITGQFNSPPAENVSGEGRQKWKKEIAFTFTLHGKFYFSRGCRKEQPQMNDLTCGCHVYKTLFIEHEMSLYALSFFDTFFWSWHVRLQYSQEQLIGGICGEISDLYLLVLIRTNEKLKYKPGSGVLN